MSEKSVLQTIECEVPLPICTFNEDGDVDEANDLIGQVFLYDGIVGTDIFQLTGIRYDDLVAAADNQETLQIQKNEKSFKLSVRPIKKDDPEGQDRYIIYFMDVTAQNQAEQKYQEEKPCIALVNVDNFDELSSSTSEDDQLTVIGAIDKKIRAWAATIEASVTRHKEDGYFILFDWKYLQEQEELKFPILDEMRTIDTDADFPVTISIGIGVGGSNPAENDEFADQAIDLALGRGGDQVVVKNGEKISYFGGKALTVEKGNKGKSRIIGHAMQGLMKSASRVLIMGHKNPDMDALGAALGVYRLAERNNKETHIVLEKYNEAVESLMQELNKDDQHSFISHKKAISLVDRDTLIVVVDTHRPSITECPQLLGLGCRTVVIDHHRKGEEFVDHPTLSYTEPYASSTAELVSEILQYTGEKKDISKIEAEALMAGIFVDTNRFSVKTGVRTLEAAAWLRRLGADPAAVKRFFQVGRDSLVQRSKTISAAEFDEFGRAFAVCEGENENAKIINSQVADQLLTVRGVNYSFVAGKDEEGHTVVSARSIGENNVQIIMERFGGGGHLNTAGAEVDCEPAEALEKIKEVLEEL